MANYMTQKKLAPDEPIIPTVQSMCEAARVAGCTWLRAGLFGDTVILEGWHEEPDPHPHSVGLLLSEGT
jgi:hypothetical protein